MAKSLVIVESPAKAKTIEKFLGKNYKVLASYGHVRALPSKKGSVSVENDFEPHYAILPKSKSYLDNIRKESKKVEELILATDPDREGEAIAWHLLESIGVTEDDHRLKVKRVAFHEITLSAVSRAMEEARGISHPLVDAQQARSILDYLVGFNLSPFLWKKISYGLSAGRVQSVALRLICEREKEIKAFRPEEYWTLEAVFENCEKKRFPARLFSIDDEKLEKFSIRTEPEARKVFSELEKVREKQDFLVSSVSCKEKKRHPRTSVHYQYASTGSQPEAWFSGSQNHERRTETL